MHVHTHTHSHTHARTHTHSYLYKLQLLTVYMCMGKRERERARQMKRKMWESETAYKKTTANTNYITRAWDGQIAEQGDHVTYPAQDTYQLRWAVQCWCHAYTCYVHVHTSTLYHACGCCSTTLCFAYRAGRSIWLPDLSILLDNIIIIFPVSQKASCGALCIYWALKCVLKVMWAEVMQIFWTNGTSFLTYTYMYDNLLKSWNPDYHFHLWNMATHYCEKFPITFVVLFKIFSIAHVQARWWNLTRKDT